MFTTFSEVSLWDTCKLLRLTLVNRLYPYETGQNITKVVAPFLKITFLCGETLVYHSTRN